MKKTITIAILTFLLTNVPVGLADDPNFVAGVEINPQTLNLKSKGNWITCFIWFPEDYNVADIDPESILLEDEIEPEWVWFDEAEDAAMAKFSRFDVQQWLLSAGLSGNVELTVSGELADSNSTSFAGSDTIKVLGPALPSFVITRLKVIKGKTAGNDSIAIRGTIDALISDIADANSIAITIKNDVPAVVYSESIPFSVGSLQKGKFQYKASKGAITKLVLDVVKHQFMIQAKGIDLSSLTYPITLEIVIGSYSDSASSG